MIILIIDQLNYFRIKIHFTASTNSTKNTILWVSSRVCYFVLSICCQSLIISNIVLTIILTIKNNQKFVPILLSDYAVLPAFQ